MVLKDLTKISQELLLKEFTLVVSRERGVTVELIHYISEIRKRRLYAEQGYSSLFSFLTEKYGYSGGGAYRRIQASKVSELFPQVLTYLLEGKLNLMALSLIEPHLNKDNAADVVEKVIGKKKEEIEYLLSNLFGKQEKTRDRIRRLPVVQEIVKRSDEVKNDNENKKSQRGIPNNPPLAFFEPRGSHLNSSMRRDGGNENGEVNWAVHFHSESKIHPQNESEHFRSESEMNRIEAGNRGVKVIQPEVKEIRRVKVEFVCDEGVAGLIERAKEIMRHKYPEARLEDLMREAFELLLEKKDPERKIARGAKKSEGNKREQKPEKREGERQKEERQGPRGDKKVDEKPQRKQQIKNRYIPEVIRQEVWSRDHGECRYMSPDGRQCRERRFLELDHIMPWGLGGKTTAENLQLLCHAHNQLRAQKTFGNKMAGVERIW